MLWRTTGDRRYFEFIKRELDPFVDEQGNLIGVTLDSLDNIMPGNVMVAPGFWHGKHLPGEMWIGGVFMGQMCLIRYGASIGDAEHCFVEAVRQITVFASHCLKGDSGLYLHAWAAQPDLAKVWPGTTERWAGPVTGLSSEVWSEGLGWYALDRHLGDIHVYPCATAGHRDRSAERDRVHACGHARLSTAGQGAHIGLETTVLRADQVVAQWNIWSYSGWSVT
jgi:rhamnogalacturonyl hydrolase YesR